MSARRSLTARDSSSLRAGASPSQNGMFGGDPLASATRTVPAGDLQHPPRRVPELEDVAGHALDGEILVDGADERLVRLEDDAIVRDLRNRAARCLREEAGAAAAAQRSG